MPHIVFNKTELINAPSAKDGVDFKFIAKSYNFTSHERNTEYKIAVENENKEFLLTLKNKDDNQMIKIDKVTRIAPITLVNDTRGKRFPEVLAGSVRPITVPLRSSTDL